MHCCLRRQQWQLLRPPQQRRQWEIKPNQPFFLLQKLCIYTIIFQSFYILLYFLHFRFHHCTLQKVHMDFIGHWSFHLFHLTQQFSNHTYSSATWHTSAIILWLYHQESHTYYNYKNCLETHETIHMLMTLVLLPFILPIRSRSFRCFIALYAVWIFKAACSVVFGSWKVKIRHP